jgi:hypothetical protein
MYQNVFVTKISLPLYHTTIKMYPLYLFDYETTDKGRIE